MATYVEYLQEDGTVLLVEVSEPEGRAIKATNKVQDTIIKAEQKFEDALAPVKSSVQTLCKGFSEMQIEEGEITFGIKTSGEMGLFAVCKAGAEINYQVRLKWSRKYTEAPAQQPQQAAQKPQEATKQSS